jgi:hypothetical protein
MDLWNQQLVVRRRPDGIPLMTSRYRVEPPISNDTTDPFISHQIISSVCRGFLLS